MPRRKVQLVNDEFYHIAKRGAGNRDIFLDEEDRLRFVNSLLVFNDDKPVPWKSRAFWYQHRPEALLKSGYKPKIPLVEIHAFALMRNHFHLLVRQLMEGGIVKLMKKLGGYSFYFNRKYDGEGALYQARYKIKRINGQDQAKNTFVYIKTNPVEIIEPGWKDWVVVNPERTIQFLEKEYRWSSYWDYLGKENFSSLISKGFFISLFDGKEGIKKEVDSWILFKAGEEKEKFENIFIE